MKIVSWSTQRGQFREADGVRSPTALISAHSPLGRAAAIGHTHRSHSHTGKHLQSCRIVLRRANAAGSALGGAIGKLTPGNVARIRKNRVAVLINAVLLVNVFAVDPMKINELHNGVEAKAQPADEKDKDFHDTLPQKRALRNAPRLSGG